MKLCGSILLLTMLLIHVPNLWGQAGPVIEYRYYQVQVTGIESVRAQTSARRPQTWAGEKDSRTDWRIDYTFNSVRKYGNNCQVGTYEITSSCTITLPKYQSSDAILAVRLKSYEELLKIHELKHCEIVAEHVRKFDEWIDSIRYYNGGDILNSVRYQYAAFLAQCAKAQRDYDQMTSYGRREGADLTLLLPLPESETKSGPGQSLDEGDEVETIQDGTLVFQEPMGNYYQDDNGVRCNDGRR